MIIEVNILFEGRLSAATIVFSSKEEVLGLIPAEHLI
jgi:hypothetical protein